MRIIIITYPVPKDIKSIITLKKDDYIIGVDQAISYLKAQKIDCHLAIGDFDSLSDLSILKGLKVETLSPVKDVTDTEYALSYAIDLNPSDIILVGGMGGERIEHFYAHLLLFQKYPKLIFLSDQTKITRLDEGTYETTYDGFISFFAYPDAILSLKGFKYNLNHHHLELFDPLGISNERILDQGVIEVHQGAVLMYESKRI